MKILLAIGMILALLAGCAHTPHPYKTGTYDLNEHKTKGLMSNLTHADAPPMPDTTEFWTEPMPWWGPIALVGFLIMALWPAWIWLALWMLAGA